MVEFSFKKIVVEFKNQYKKLKTKNSQKKS